MPNPFEPTLIPTLPATTTTTAPPRESPKKPPPEFLPASSFSPHDWPTWSSMEPSLQNLIANSYTTTQASTLNNTTNDSVPPLVHQFPLRKRRLSSKPANDQQHQQTDPAHLLSGDGADFGVNEVVEALRGKVEVERVFEKLMERRRRK